MTELTSVHVQAPTNIALIKYMGKTDSLHNLPTNPSLSMTLSGLGTDILARFTPSSSGDEVSFFARRA